jgi:hypothetical protein
LKDVEDAAPAGDGVSDHLALANHRAGAKVRRLVFRLREVRVDVRGELLQLEQFLIEDPLDDAQIDLQVAMHQDVAEASERAQTSSEFCGKHTNLGELVYCSGVVRGIEAACRDEVRSDVQHILHAELQAALDRPSQIGVCAQLRGGAALVSLQIAERLA